MDSPAPDEISTTPETASVLPLAPDTEEVFEERRSRIVGVVKLFGGMLLCGLVVAVILALSIGLLAGLTPRLIVVEPGTTPEPVPSASATGDPEPVETVTRGPSVGPPVVNGP